MNISVKQFSRKLLRVYFILYFYLYKNFKIFFKSMTCFSRMFYIIRFCLEEIHSGVTQRVLNDLLGLPRWSFEHVPQLLLSNFFLLFFMYYLEVLFVSIATLRSRLFWLFQFWIHYLMQFNPICPIDLKPNKYWIHRGMFRIRYFYSSSDMNLLKH